MSLNLNWIQQINIVIILFFFLKKKHPKITYIDILYITLSFFFLHKINVLLKDVQFITSKRWHEETFVLTDLHIRKILSCEYTSMKFTFFFFLFRYLYKIRTSYCAITLFKIRVTRCDCYVYALFCRIISHLMPLYVSVFQLVEYNIIIFNRVQMYFI